MDQDQALIKDSSDYNKYYHNLVEEYDMEHQNLSESKETTDQICCQRGCIARSHRCAHSGSCAHQFRGRNWWSLAANLGCGSVLCRRAAAAAHQRWDGGSTAEVGWVRLDP